MPHTSVVGQEMVMGTVPHPGEHDEGIRAGYGPRREEVAE